VDGASVYQYVGSNPNVFVDPMGLQGEERPLTAGSADDVMDAMGPMAPRQNEHEKARDEGARETEAMAAGTVAGVDEAAARAAEEAAVAAATGPAGFFLRPLRWIRKLFGRNKHVADDVAEHAPTKPPSQPAAPPSAPKPAQSHPQQPKIPPAKYPDDLLPHKPNIEGSFIGKFPFDKIPKDIRDRAADYYDRVAGSDLSEIKADRAKRLNELRAKFLRGDGISPPPPGRAADVPD